MREPRTHIFQGHDGAYHAFVTVGTKRDGSLDRRHRQSNDYAEVAAKVLELEDAVDQGETPKVGKSPTFEAWLTEWLRDIAPLTAKYKALGTYRSMTKNYLIPYLGQWKVSQLTKRHFAEMYRDLSNIERLAPASVHTVHRVARTALNRARDFEVVGLRSNPAADAVNSLPKVSDDEVDPLTTEEIGRVLKVASERRNHPRWWLAFLGPRQGEALGGMWNDIEWDIGYEEMGMFHISRQLQRQKYRHGCDDPKACVKNIKRCVPEAGCGTNCRARVWEHGCDNPASCAATHCKRPRKKACQPGCTAHARSCRDRKRSECRTAAHRTGCKPGCTGHARYCPSRAGGLILVETETDNPGKRRPRTRRGRKTERPLRPKTRAGKRDIPLLKEVVVELLVHKLHQDEERQRAGNLWTDMGLMFTDPFGRPIDPRRDLDEWGEILDEAGVDYIHLHGARDSAATEAGSQNIDPLVRNAFMGWANGQTAPKYQTVRREHLVKAAQQIGRAVFQGSLPSESASTADMESLIRMLATGAATSDENAAGSDPDEV